MKLFIGLFLLYLHKHKICVCAKISSEYSLISIFYDGYESADLDQTPHMHRYFISAL